MGLLLVTHWWKGNVTRAVEILVIFYFLVLLKTTCTVVYMLYTLGLEGVYILSGGIFEHFSTCMILQ